MVFWMFYWEVYFASYIVFHSAYLGKRAKFLLMN